MIQKNIKHQSKTEKNYKNIDIIYAQSVIRDFLCVIEYAAKLFKNGKYKEIEKLDTVYKLLFGNKISLGEMAIEFSEMLIKIKQVLPDEVPPSFEEGQATETLSENDIVLLNDFVRDLEKKSVKPK